MRKISTKITDNIFFFLLLSIALISQGCIAALPFIAAAGLALEAFTVYKVVQLTTGGSAEVRFANNPIDPGNKKTLLDIKRLAIWPTYEGGTDQSAIELTEKLQESGYFDVVSPHTVIETLKNLEVTSSEGNMTQSEKFALFKKVGDTLNTDAVVCPSSFESGGFDTNYWSLKRSEQTRDFSITIYSNVYDRTLWKEDGQLAIKGTSSIPGEQEIRSIFVSSVTEKFLTVTGKR